MTFTEPHQTPPAADDAPAPKPRARQRSVRPVVTPPPIQTRLAPNCAWPTDAAALPTRRGKRR